MQAVTVIHSTGINWGQALATWIPIVIALIGGFVTAIAALRRWNERRQTRLETTFNNVASKFATALGDQLKDVHRHLEQQDKRLDRIDRNTGTDST